MNNKYITTYEIMAIQFTDEDSIKAITRVYPFCSYDEDLKLLVVPTQQGILCMNKGDYIAEVFGSPVIITTDIFEECFKKVGNKNERN